MGKSKKNLDDLKKDLGKKDIKPIKKDDQDKLVGGKGKNKNWNSGCGGIVPQ
jgi:hypothetical protein